MSSDLANDSLSCDRDGARRDLVRHGRSNGFDYVEVDCAQTSLTVYFLGRAPQWDDARYLRLDGGRRERDLRILDIGISRSEDDGIDDTMTVHVDRPGDFSTYRLCAIELDAEGTPTGRPHPDFDPRYACVAFAFKAGCASDLDCAVEPLCEEPPLDEPAIDYLAKDYSSFRRLLLDRLALTLPDWRERHVPDLGITLVELLAYVGDELSYYQDAVATEAYLDSARQRISVRRHARLVDYRLHEGNNARAWLVFDVSDRTVELDPADFAVASKLPDTDGPMLAAGALAGIDQASYVLFEPVSPAKITLRRARNRIDFYTWLGEECCLAQGSTRATLVDPGAVPAPPPRRETDDDCADDTPVVDVAAGVAAGRWHELHLALGDVLIFEEVTGPRTGDAADADQAHRHAVRLIRATPSWDPLNGTLVYEIEWCIEDALPFALCLSAIADAPDCAIHDRISVAWGNVVLADHGAPRVDDLGSVPEASIRDVCATDCTPAETASIPGRYYPALPRPDLTFAEPLPTTPLDDCGGCGRAAAAALVEQDVLAALPQVSLSSVASRSAGAPTVTRQWSPRADLLGSGPDDFHFTVEVDDRRVAWLRFGDGDCGRAPEAGEVFTARYRTGTGPAGNVGADTLTHVVFSKAFPDGVTIGVRNPLAARGGAAFEPVAEAKLRAPHVFRNRLERAVIPADYAAIVRRDFAPTVQRAAAVMRATGVRAAVQVAVDTLGRDDPGQALLDCIAAHLERYRRIGHDVRVCAAKLVPLDIEITICVAPGFQRGHVEAAVRAELGTGLLPGGRRGFFHPDSLTFADAITVSALVAAVQRLEGVCGVVVDKLERLFEGPNDEKANGLLPLGPLEIARLSNDPDFPENGKLTLAMEGGR